MYTTDLFEIEKIANMILFVIARDSGTNLCWYAYLPKERKRTDCDKFGT